MISRRNFVAASALATLFSSGPVSAASSSLPWRNWSGGLLAHPTGRFAPGKARKSWLCLDQRPSTGSLRPVGAGHSFSPLVPTDGHLLVLDGINGHGEPRCRGAAGYLRCGHPAFQHRSGAGKRWPGPPDPARHRPPDPGRRGLPPAPTAPDSHSALALRQRHGDAHGHRRPARCWKSAKRQIPICSRRPV